MPSKNFSHPSRHLVLTNGRFWNLGAQKVIFPTALKFDFFPSFKKSASAKFSQKQKDL